MPAVRRGLMLTLVAGLLLAIAGCGGGSDSSSTTTASEGAAQSEAAQTGTKPKVEVPSGPAPRKLVSKELIEGEGAEAKAGDEVTVQYVGVLYKTGEQFDASWDRGEPFTFTLGAGEVIAGWDQGMEGMKVGGRRMLIIPPKLGYGSQAMATIPANSTLVFVVDLLAVK